MSRWTRDYATGVVICAVCGSDKNGRKSCCRTAPFVDLDTFRRRVFGDEDAPMSIIREFHEDYLLSDHKNLKEYIEAISSPI